jgi:hypothetical protein
MILFYPQPWLQNARKASQWITGGLATIFPSLLKYQYLILEYTSRLSTKKKEEKTDQKVVTLKKPISEEDQKSFQRSISNSTNIACLLHNSALAELTPIHSKAINFSQNLGKESALDTKRITHLQGRPAKEVVEQQAGAVTQPLQCCLKLALSTCKIQTSTKNKISGFFQNRQEVKTRFQISNLLHLADPVGSANSIDDLIFVNQAHFNFCNMATSIKPLITNTEGMLIEQLQNLKATMTKRIHASDLKHNIEVRQKFRKRQQTLLAKLPKRAHAETFGKTNSQRAGIQVLKDLNTGVIETEPTKVATVIQKKHPGEEGGTSTAAQRTCNKPTYSA